MSTAATWTRLLTIEEAAKRLNVSRATAYRMVYDGRLPTLQLGGRGSALRVDEAELEQWLYGDAGGLTPFDARSLAERGVPDKGQSTAPALAGQEAAA